MPDAVPHGSVQDGRVPPYDLVVFAISGRDQYQGRYTRKVNAGGVVEIELPHPATRRTAAACRLHTAGVQRRESGRAEVPVRSGHQDHIRHSLPSWFSEVTTLDPDPPTFRSQEGSLMSPTHTEVTAAPADLDPCGHEEHPDCGIRDVLDRIGDKWSVLVIVELAAWAAPVP